MTAIVVVAAVLAAVALIALAAWHDARVDRAQEED